MYSALTFPPGATQDASAFLSLWKFWDATWERAVAVGSLNWPPPHPPWAEGVVTSVTEDGNSYVVECGPVDSGPSWVVEGYHGAGSQPAWVGYRPPDGSPGIPTAYDLVIEGDPRMPWQTVRGPINGQFPTGATGETVPSGSQKTVTISGVSPGSSQWGLPIQHALAGKFITGLSSLAGRKWHIIKRGGLWSSDRMPELQNDHEKWRGNCGGGQAHYPPAPVLPTDPPIGPLYSYVEDADVTVNWAVDRWVGYDLLVFDAANLLRRVTILNNDARRLYFTAATWTGGGLYTINPVGARGVPGRRVWRPGAWYRGAGTEYYTHMPTDNGLGTGCVVGASKVYWMEMGSDDACVLKAHPPSGSAIDVDLVINEREYDAECDSGKTDDFASPHLYKSFRHLQYALLNLCSNYVMTPPGELAAKMYLPAQWFRSIGLPNGSGTIYRDSDGNASFDVGGEGVAAGGVYYAVYEPDGTSTKNGYVSVPSGGVAHPPDVGTPEDTSGGTDAGKPVLWSLSYRRYWERRVRYLEPRTCFQPDVLVDDIGSKTIADPPHPTAVLDEDGEPTGDYSGDGTGSWIRRPPSTSYAEFDDTGLIGDYGPAFVAGDLVRVWGDNYADPTIGELVPGDAPFDSTARLLLPYYDKFFRGTYAGNTELTYRGGRSGTASAGGVNRLTDATQDWWTDGVNHGVLVTHTYTASAGSATTVTLPIDVADHTSQEATWFGVDRFVGMPSGKPFVDFVVEIDRVEAGATVTHKFVIADCVTTGGHVLLTFVGETGFTAAAGQTVRIREPAYQLNKHETRTIGLVSPTGQQYYAVVRHNDGNTLWLDTVTGAGSGPLTITAGWTYAMDYVPPGTVLRRTSTGWAIPLGNDTARLGVASPRDFVSPPANNLPTYVKGYGLHHRHDRIMDNTMLTELYRGINLLKQTPQSFAWETRADPVTPENNRRSLSSPPTYWNSSGFDIYGTARPTTLQGAVDDANTLSHDPIYFPAPDSEYASPPFFQNGFFFQGRYGPPEDGQLAGYQSSAVQAYPAYYTSSGMLRLGATVTFYLYGAITSTDPDEGNTDDTSDGPEFHRTSLTFDGRGVCAYRQWTAGDSVTVTAGDDVHTRYVGALVGSIDDVDPPIVEPVPDEASQPFFTSDATTGFYVSKTVAVVSWYFRYQTGTW